MKKIEEVASDVTEETVADVRECLAGLVEVDIESRAMGSSELDCVQGSVIALRVCAQAMLMFGESPERERMKADLLLGVAIAELAKLGWTGAEVPKEG